MTAGLKVWDYNGNPIFLANRTNLKFIGKLNLQYSPEKLNMTEAMNFSAPPGSHRVACVACLPSNNESFHAMPPHVWTTDTGIAWGYFDNGVNSQNIRDSCVIYYGYVENV